MKYLLSFFCLGMLLAFDLSGTMYRNGGKVYEPGEIDPSCSYQSGPCVCYCPVTRFREEKYCTQRCVYEPYTVEKKCCRYVDQGYTKKGCRYVDQPYEVKCTKMVPQYSTKSCVRYVKVPQYYERSCCKMVPECYTKTCYKKVPQYYDIPCSKKVPQYYTECETKYCKKWVTDEKCCYKPYTCIEKRCVNCPPNNGSQNTMNQNGNEQRVALNKPDDHAEMTTEDATLASKIRSQISSSSTLESNETILIEVNSGNVKLSGSVASNDKKMEIQELVASLPGVQNVDNQIQVNSGTY